MEIQRKIGVAIRNCRKQTGLSQQELAADADMERSYISAIENGRKCLRVDTLIRLAKALNVEPGQLLDKALEGKQL